MHALPWPPFKNAHSQARNSLSRYACLEVPAVEQTSRVLSQHCRLELRTRVQLLDEQAAMAHLDEVAEHREGLPEHLGGAPYACLHCNELHGW